MIENHSHYLISSFIWLRFLGDNDKSWPIILGSQNNILKLSVILMSTFLTKPLECIFHTSQGSVASSLPPTHVLHHPTLHMNKWYKTIDTP